MVILIKEHISVRGGAGEPRPASPRPVFIGTLMNLSIGAKSLTSSLPTHESSVMHVYRPLKLTATMLSIRWRHKN